MKRKKPVDITMLIFGLVSIIVIFLGFFTLVLNSDSNKPHECTECYDPVFRKIEYKGSDLATNMCRMGIEDQLNSTNISVKWREIWYDPNPGGIISCTYEINGYERTDQYTHDQFLKWQEGVECNYNQSWSCRRRM